jgi:urease subunit alpha
MKAQRGPLPQDAGLGNDNFRAKRYVAKYTINPRSRMACRAISARWRRASSPTSCSGRRPSSGCKPDIVIKGGAIAAAPMGDPNASIPTPQPVHYRPMFGAFGKARTATALTFVSRAAMANGLRERLGVAREMVAVENVRGGIAKRDMIHNGATPDIQVDPETYAVTADGELLVCEPATELPMAQRYFLF